MQGYETEEYWREEIARLTCKRIKTEAAITKMQYHLEDAQIHKWWSPYQDEMAAKIPYLTRDLERYNRQLVEARRALAEIQSWRSPPAVSMDYESSE